MNKTHGDTYSNADMIDSEWEERMVSQLDNGAFDSQQWLEELIGRVMTKYCSPDDVMYLRARFWKLDDSEENVDDVLPRSFRAMEHYTKRSVRWNYKKVRDAQEKIKLGLKKDYYTLYMILTMSGGIL